MHCKNFKKKIIQILLTESKYIDFNILLYSFIDLFMTSLPNLPVVMDRPFGQFTNPVESEHINDIEDADTEPSDYGYLVTPVDQPRGRPHGKQPLLARPYHPV